MMAMQNLTQFGFAMLNPVLPTAIAVPPSPPYAEPLLTVAPVVVEVPPLPLASFLLTDLASSLLVSLCAALSPLPPPLPALVWLLLPLLTPVEQLLVPPVPLALPPVVFAWVDWLLVALPPAAWAVAEASPVVT